MPSAKAPRMVLSSTSVRLVTKPDLVSAPFQETVEKVEGHEGPEVPDMGIIVDGRTAPVDQDLSRYQGFEGFQAAG